MFDLFLYLGLYLWLFLSRYLWLHQLFGWAYWGEVTPSVALEALDLLATIFFFVQLEFLFLRATICNMYHLMASIAHEMRLLLLFLLHLSLISFLSPFLSFDLAPMHANANHITKASLILHRLLKSGFNIDDRTYPGHLIDFVGSVSARLGGSIFCSLLLHVSCLANSSLSWFLFLLPCHSFSNVEDQFFPIVSVHR